MLVEMDKLPFFNSFLYKKVLHFEWILIILCCIAQALAWRYAPPDPTAPNLKVSLLLLGIVAALSFVRPQKGTYYDRLCYLFLDLIVISGAISAGLARFLFPLFVVVVAKACLLLDRKGLIIVFVSAFFCQVAFYSFKIAIVNPNILAHGVTVVALINLIGGALVSSYAPVAMMVLVAMVTLSLLAEQNQRLETERLSREVQSLATELERTRIAREIHDSLGHTLTSLNIQLDIARKLHDRDPEKSTESLELAKQLASQSLTDVRMAIQSIRDTSDFNFEKSLHGLLDDVKQRNGMEVDVKLDAPDLPSSVAFQVFRVIQECLTNVQKHAEASEVKIELEQSGEKIRLVVSDNGVGMPTEEQHSGFGIRGMRERIESMNGIVIITAQPNEGTNINVSIPLKTEVT
jgi:signal transduction histidine kinase